MRETEPLAGKDRGAGDKERAPNPDEIGATAEMRDDAGYDQAMYPPRRKKIPIILFILTCVSTFWVGATQWSPLYYFPVEWVGSQDSFLGAYPYFDFMPLRQTLSAHWHDGLIYMLCLLAILLTHEMGHFLATVWHRIRASLPYFLPLPINAIGTLGAVIVMDARKGDRRETFDIGIAGPIAGLVVAIPILMIGVQQLDLTTPKGGGLAFENPLAIQMLFDYYHQPPGYSPGEKVWISQLNPYYMAGWVGLLITGLNMLPVSQLDGGHVIYTLFGRKWAHWIARGFLVLAIAYVVYASVYIWVLMIFLVLMIGAEHPPTRDDTVPLGWFRTTLGYASLAIPILCFPPKGISFATGM